MYQLTVLMSVRSFLFGTFQGARTVCLIRRFGGGRTRTYHPRSCCNHTRRLYRRRTTSTTVRRPLFYDRRSYGGHSRTATGTICKQYTCKIIGFRRVISGISYGCRCRTTGNASGCEPREQCRIASHHSTRRSYRRAIRYRKRKEFTVLRPAHRRYRRASYADYRINNRRRVQGNHLISAYHHYRLQAKIRPRPTRPGSGRTRTNGHRAVAKSNP